MKKVKIIFAIVIYPLVAVASFFVGAEIHGRYFLAERKEVVKEQVEFDEPITVHFEKPILIRSLSGGVSVSPQVDFDVVWSEDGTSATVAPRGKWRDDTNYTVSFVRGRTRALLSSAPLSISFRTQKSARVVRVSPDGNQPLLLGRGDTITVDFDRDTTGMDIAFSLTPPAAFENIYDKTNSRWTLTLTDALKINQTYTFSVFARGAGSVSRPSEIFTTRLATIPELPDYAKKPLPDRVLFAKKYTPAQFVDGKYIDVDRTHQVLVTFENGAVLGAYPISTGRAGMETPAGEYAVRNKHPRPWSKQYSLYMPYWMAITSDGKYGIHELPEWPGGVKEGQNHLGIPVSHGCIRLGVGDAAKVYAWTEIGTKVVVR